MRKIFLLLIVAVLAVIVAIKLNLLSFLQTVPAQAPGVQVTSNGITATGGQASQCWRNRASATGTMEGARTPCGNIRPITCIAASAGLLGANVNTILLQVRCASADSTRTASAHW